MSTDKKRTYTSESRQVQALQTRTRILEAAKKLFQDKGFEDVNHLQGGIIEYAKQIKENN